MCVLVSNFTQGCVFCIQSQVCIYIYIYIHDFRENNVFLRYESYLCVYIYICVSNINVGIYAYCQRYVHGYINIYTTPQKVALPEIRVLYMYKYIYIYMVLHMCGYRSTLSQKIRAPFEIQVVYMNIYMSTYIDTNIYIHIHGPIYLCTYVHFH